MDVNIRYKVYELNRVMGSDDHKAFKECYFPLLSNNFMTEEEAIEALIKENWTYEDFIILKTVYIQH